MAGLGINLPVFLLCYCCIATASSDILVIVNESSPVDALTTEQVRNLFLSRAAYFPDTDVPAELVDQPVNNAVFTNFYQKVANMTPLKLNRYRARIIFSGRGRLPTEVEDNQSAVNAVLASPNAIAYVDSQQVPGGARVVCRLSGAD